MFERDESLALLTRTPDEMPRFDGELDRVARRARTRRRRRLVLQGSVGVVIAVGVVAPMLLLAGVIGGPSSGGFLDGSSGQPRNLIRWYEPSASMDPSIKVGETVLVDTNAYKFGRLPQTGDMVLFTFTAEGQESEFVKRVIGLPGQVILIRHGVVFVEGHQLQEPYLNRTPDPADYGPYTVEAASVFVLGDNRFNSNDSRGSLGQIPLETLLGKVVGRSSVPGGPPPTASVVSVP
jgi:signal peptidase I